MDTVPTINQWTRERRCIICGGAFSLSVHNTTEAQRAARHLQEGTLDAAALPPLVSKCPDCLAGRRPAAHAAAPASAAAAPVSSAKEQQAVAAAMALGQQMNRAQYDEVYYYAKRVGLFTGLLSMGGILLVYGYNQLGQEDFNPLPWLIILAIAAVAGFGASLWAFRQSRGD